MRLNVAATPRSCVPLSLGRFNGRWSMRQCSRREWFKAKLKERTWPDAQRPRTCWTQDMSLYHLEQLRASNRLLYITVRIGQGCLDPIAIETGHNHCGHMLQRSVALDRSMQLPTIH